MIDRPVYARAAARSLLLSLLVGGSLAASAAADETTSTIPSGTRIKFHVDETISSNQSKTGAPFVFELLSPITLADREIPVAGTRGIGTIYLAGHAGTSGHEGDLTLRLDRLTTQDGHSYTFDDQRFHVDGRNRKVVSGVLGFVPFVGFGSRFIRGSDVRVDATTPIETVLARPAVTAPDKPEAGLPSPPDAAPSPHAV